jgi:hypothetical protein
MGTLRAQGAGGLRSGAMCFLLGKKHQTQSRGSVLTAGAQLGQGATEYLVLLAVVLIVALVSVALLGFFPGMASDAQVTQSKTYWQGAQPVAITEWRAVYYAADTHPYFRVKNNGAYPIRITKMLGANQSISMYYNGSGNLNISDDYYMAPGEERWFGNWNAMSGLPGVKGVVIRASGASATYYLYAAAQVCNSDGSGSLEISSFGFEYIQYIDGQQITKREVSPNPLVIKCG